MSISFVVLERRGGPAIACFCLLVFAYLVLRHSELPNLGDYSQWTYHGVLLRNVLQHHPSSAYTLKAYPVPNSLTTIGLGALMLFLPWAFAAKVWLLLGLAFAFYSALHLQAQSGDMQGWRIPLIAGACLFGLSFWYGFTNYDWAVALAMLFCSLLLQDWRTKWGYGALLVVLFFAHMIPYGFAITVFGLYVLQSRRWALLVQTIPSICFTAWYIAARKLLGDLDQIPGMTAQMPSNIPFFVLFKVNSFLKIWGFVNPTLNGTDSQLLRIVSPTVFVFLFILNVLVGFIVLTLIGREIWQSVREKAANRFFWASIALFAGAAVFMPNMASGISDPGGRMLGVCLWSAACMAKARRRVTRLVLLGSTTVLLLVNLFALDQISMQRIQVGAMSSRLPSPIWKFGHAEFANQFQFLDLLSRGSTSAPIYPTAMFVEDHRAGNIP